MFTVYGLMGFFWVVLWSVLVSERPSHGHVALLHDKDSDEAPVRIPYRAFATCLPLWAIIIVETSHGKNLYNVALLALSCMLQEVSGLVTTVKQSEMDGLWPVPERLVTSVSASEALYKLLTECVVKVICAAGIGQYVAFFWQPTYYVEVFSVELRNASLYSILPWVASAVFTNVAGWVADALISRSALSLTAVRKLMEGLSCFGAAACLLLLALLPQVSASCFYHRRVHREGIPVSNSDVYSRHQILLMNTTQGLSAWMAIGLFTAMQSFAGCHVSGAACQHLDINARYAAAMYGLTNGLSTVLEAGGIAGAGFILETQHSWGLLFAVVAGLHVFGGLVYVCFSDSKARFQEASRKGHEKLTP